MQAEERNIAAKYAPEVDKLFLQAWTVRSGNA